jgi:hypothetical protein
MTQVNPSLPVVGQPDATEEPKIVTALSQIVGAVNNVDSSQITDGVVQPEDLQSVLNDKLGISAGATVRRGKSIIATTESRSNTAYGTLTTPDRVTGIVLPTDGLIAVAYQATWSDSVGGAGRAAIFIGANQLKIAQFGGAAAPIVQEAAFNNGTNDSNLVTAMDGLRDQGGMSVAYGGDVTTGQIIGLSGGYAGPCLIFAAAGTYDVSVQFKATSGSVTAKNRKLWVWSIGF